MGHTTTIELSCDLPTCTSTILTNASTVTAARREAEKRGWHRRYGPTSCGYDLCEEHADEVPGGTFPERKPFVSRSTR